MIELAWAYRNGDYTALALSNGFEFTQQFPGMAEGTSLDAATSPDLRGERLPASAIGPIREESLEARTAALEALYGTHARKVKAYYRRSGVGDAASEDLTQEAFARALRGLGQFRGSSKMSTWLWTIAQNLLLEHRRKPAIDPAMHDGEPVDVDALTIHQDPHLIDCRDCVRRGFEAFSKDHPERAQVIFLAIVEELTREELAEFLGRSTHAATEYLSQCKSKFKAYIGHCHEE
ncbi:MAG: RNA polymerase sigma factor [Burkholderiales bacterium]|nr:RNA polymerase sigma factor [Burkholderiales bacterium]